MKKVNYLSQYHQKLNRLLSLAKLYQNGILLVLSLGLASFSMAISLELQKVSKGTDITLEKYREVLTDRSLEAAVVEESFGNPTILKIGFGLVLGISFFLLTFLISRVVRDTFPGYGFPPEGVAGSVEPQMGGRLDDFLVRGSEQTSRFWEQFMKVDPSVFVPEGSLNHLLELVDKVIMFCLR